MAPRLIGTMVAPLQPSSGCSQRVSLPVVFRPYRWITLSLIVEGEINPSPPNSFLGIKVATGLAALPPGTGNIL